MAPPTAYRVGEVNHSISSISHRIRIYKQIMLHARSAGPGRVRYLQLNVNHCIRQYGYSPGVQASGDWTSNNVNTRKLKKWNTRIPLEYERKVEYKYVYSICIPLYSTYSSGIHDFSAFWNTKWNTYVFTYHGSKVDGVPSGGEGE